MPDPSRAAPPGPRNGVVQSSTSPRLVGVPKLTSILYSLPAPFVALRDYPEIASGMARAANSDPLFPHHPAGSEATACLLVAAAWHATRFVRTAARGRTLGLYGIRIPPNARVRASTVMLASSSSLVAVDRIRESLRRSEGMPWGRRLAPLVAEQRGEREGAPASQAAELEGASMMMLAERLLSRYFPKARMPRGLLLTEGEDS